METLRKASDQFPPATGRKTNAVGEEDDADEQDTNQSSQSQADKGRVTFDLTDWFDVLFVENTRSTTASDKQPRSPAIAIVRSNSRAPPPQVEPFFRPKPAPAANQQTSSQSTATNDFVSHSLPNNGHADMPLTSGTNASDKKPRSQVSEEHPEEPRTPHSRAKNIARFYPVTKDSPVVKPDVSSEEDRNTWFDEKWTFRHLVWNVKHVTATIHRLKVLLVGCSILGVIRRTALAIVQHRQQHPHPRRRNNEAILWPVRRKIARLRECPSVEVLLCWLV